MPSVWQTLSSFDVSEEVKKKGKFDYLFGLGLGPTSSSTILLLSRSISSVTTRTIRCPSCVTPRVIPMWP